MSHGGVVENERSLLCSLWKRQTSTCCHKNAATSCKILRSVILQPRSKFTLAWSRRSQKHICIGLDRRIYFDNHNLCYHAEGFGGKPHLQYDLTKQGFKSDPLHKICAVLLYHCHILRPPQFAEEKEVCLLVLTADGYLKILSATTGAILRSVFLSTAIKYRYLSWADYLTTVQVKSIQSVASPSSSQLLTIAVFQIHPLQLVTCFPIEKDIFGNVVDANVSEDLLVVTYKTGVVKIYSLRWIIDNCTVMKASLGEFVELKRCFSADMRIRAGAMGNPGFGIPHTVVFTECPPLLFSTKSTNAVGVRFGGCPTVYLHNFSGRLNKFNLTSLRNQKSISVPRTNIVAFHPDVFEFHFEDYNRVVQISGYSMSCYWLSCNDKNQEPELSKQYAIDFRDFQTTSQCFPKFTSSGRAIRSCSGTNSDDLLISAVQDVDYENETELLYAVVTLPDSRSCSNTQCNLYFVDDRNGSVLKKVHLPTWKPDESNSIYYELDCILHLLQQRTSICYYYRLTS